VDVSKVPRADLSTKPNRATLLFKNKNKSFCGFQRKYWRMPMKYMISWFERPQGSPMEYENAQKRILEVFTQWKAPENFKIELFVIRVGDWGGYMLLDCDDPLAVHKFCSMLPAFEFQARPVVPLMDAVRVELEAIAFRDGLQRK
jgi:muconolactone delta-isomerase